MLFRVFCTFIIISMFTACSIFEEEPTKTTLPAEQIYQQAKDKLNKEEYKEALVDYELLEEEYPYSRFTKDGLIESGFASYETEDYDKAISQFRRYLQLYPGSDKADYALYMIALSYYNQIVDVRRDQSITVKAKRAFQDVLNRYPNGQYATDAKLKMDLVNSNLAGKEMEIGRYYLNKMEWVAAINRFKTVAQDYQTTPHVQEALYRLVEAYLSLGITKEARSAAAVLGHNYPQSKWYRAAYELLEGNNLTPEMQEGSWFSKVF